MLNLNNLIHYLPELIILFGILVQIVCLVFKPLKKISNFLG